MIAFFSSDARSLFQDDIFTSLAYPNQYIQHFRYEERWIDSSAIDLDKVIGKEGIIFYTSGNDTSILKEERQLDNTSIRKVKVKDYFFSKKTGLHHFYLQLGEFVDCTIDSTQDINTIPPYLFVTELINPQIQSDHWYRRVEAIMQNAVRENFKKALFFNVEFRKKSSDGKKTIEIKPTYHSDEKRSSIGLLDEGNYTVDLLLYNTNIQDDKPEDTSKITISKKTDLIDLGAPNEIIVGTEKDDQSFNLITHTVETVESFEYLIFSSTTRLINDNKEETTYQYNVPIKISIIKKQKKARAFGLWSIAAVVTGALILALVRKLVNDMTVTWWGWLIILLPIAWLFYKATYKLNFLFNKK